MATFTAQNVMDLRTSTRAGLMDCKRALADANGDAAAAIVLLRERGIATEVHAGKDTTEGVIGSYVHQGSQIAVLVELACETDFTARSEEFRALAREIAMHIASAAPDYVNPEEMPEALVASERRIIETQARNEGKPEAAIARIVEGRLKKLVEERALMTQAYCRDPKRKVGDLVQEMRARVKENVRVKRFVRYNVGESV